MGDGQGMQLLPQLGKNCHFYRNRQAILQDDILSLFKSANVWYISKDVDYSNPPSGCPKINSKGRILFTLPKLSTFPLRNGWYNITTAKIGEHNENKNLHLRKVEACKIYRNAYFKFTTRVLPNDAEDFEDCKAKAYSKYAGGFFTFTSDYFLISTRTKVKKTTCLIATKQENKVQGSIVPEISDPNAKFLIVSDDCLDRESRNIETEEWNEGERSSNSEEKDANDKDPEANDKSEDTESEEDDNNMIVAIGAGVVIGVLILGVAICAVYRCRKKRAENSGNRESVDLNHQYGAEEYYEYSKHGTNVVDENDQYNYGDYDDE